MDAAREGIRGWRGKGSSCIAAIFRDFCKLQDLGEPGRGRSRHTSYTEEIWLKKGMKVLRLLTVGSLLPMVNCARTSLRNRKHLPWMLPDWLRRLKRLRSRNSRKALLLPTRSNKLTPTGNRLRKWIDRPNWAGSRRRT